jgi:guanosine-3',5'-bis(diphosphate) 3'-pyrophosphohydrolase
MDLVEKARVFATAAHHATNHVRKYTGEPYINHPAAVVELVRSVPHTPEMLAAAWLHDVVEDTGVELDVIRHEFGLNVAEMVEMLTDVSAPHDVREHRKALDRGHTAVSSPAAKTIKLADLIDNTTSICERDPKFARVYLAEKAQLLMVLMDGDPALWDRANALVGRHERLLKQEDA